ncbi:hypothetical protein Cfor_02233 [Coptotermes formosanus]|uniref:WD repeat-containing protein 91 n=1 Tax=Coptotermes formosanus TaxID=36987 RepID=A0A6L2Q8X8_COPFO|nr:hypothetical protein Cfor_02233 [Coptotermes formosanus]
MPQPVLISFEEDAQRMKRLQEENEALRLRVATLLEGARNNAISVVDVTAPEVPPPAELMDDFYVIALESGSTGGESQAKTLKSLIRNISSGLPTSPMLGRKASSIKQRQGTGKVASAEGAVSKRQSSADQPTARPAHEPCVETTDRRGKQLQQQQPVSCQVGSALSNTGAFLLLSQEEYLEHRAAVGQCRFNSSGSTAVSADVDGVVKLWTVTPTPKTLATFTSKSTVMSLDWVTKNERYFISGNKQGLVRLYDTRDNRIMWELGADAASPIMMIRCSPVESTFICSVAAANQSAGKLLLFDIKTKKLERSLTLGCTQSSTVGSCCTFNHNGQLLVVGCSDGIVRIFDLRRSDCIDSWTAHQGETLAIQLTADFTVCYTLGSDGKASCFLCQRSLNQSGQAMWEASLWNCPPLQNLAVPYGQLFAFDPPGSYVLTCGLTGGNIYQVCGSGLNCMLELGGHRSPALAVDWAIANQCATCVTASSGDGKIKVSTLLTP